MVPVWRTNWPLPHRWVVPGVLCRKSTPYIHETVQIAQKEGEVADVYPKVGELVGTGSPIMSIAVMDDMWGTFNVREDQLNDMKVGAEFTAFVPAFNKDIKMKVSIT